MAIRTYYISDDNLGLYGKIVATGIDDSVDTFIDTGVQSQYGIVNFSKSYIRNPYCFGDNNIYLYRVAYYDNVSKTFDISELNADINVTISAFGDSLIFADRRKTTGRGPYSVDFSDSFCKTIRKNKYSLYDSTGIGEDLLNKVSLSSDPANISGSFVLPVNKSSIDDYGYDIYMLYSKYEEISGDVFAVIRGDNISAAGKSPFGISGAVFNTTEYGPSFTDVSALQNPVLPDRTMFHLGNLGTRGGDWAIPMISDIRVVTQVQPIVFVDATTTFMPPSMYEFEIDDNNDMYITFNTALTIPEVSFMTIVLLRDDTPEINLKTQNGFTSDGFYLETENISYSVINANYRVR